MPRPLLLLALACMLASGPLRADCELLYAPPEVRARLLAFHYTNELRRAGAGAPPGGRRSQIATCQDGAWSRRPGKTDRQDALEAAPVHRHALE